MASVPLYIYVAKLVAICFNLTNGHFVDVTYPINSDNLHEIPGIDYEMTILFKGTKDSNGHRSWFQDEQFKISTHTGTHMDAPCRYSKGKPCISDIPVDLMARVPGVIVDVTDKVDRDRNYRVTKADLINFENDYGKIPDGSVVIIQTGHGKFWPDKEKYLGTASDDPSKYVFPSVHQRAARFLLDERSIVGLAIESMFVDNPAVAGGYAPVAQMMAKRGVYTISNISGKIQDQEHAINFTVTAMPMNLENASGAPVRVVVKCA
ncbi:hypothetical protein HDE_01715 [Halotydeus destructor]|nr:hypothetical protein HDE_01715 [Halotydeus destructor]